MRSRSGNNNTIQGELLKTLDDSSTASEIRHRLFSLRSSDEGQWGVMTADSAVRHLRAAFLLPLEQPSLQRRSRLLPDAVIRFLALRLPVKWPQNRPTLPGLRREDLGQGSFLEDQNALLSTYDSFLRINPGQWPHPDFGQMSRWEWMRWGFLHSDHHLRQFNR